MVNEMSEMVKNYQLSKIGNKRNYKRISNAIKKIPTIVSANIEGEKNILRVEIRFKEKERNVEKRLVELEEKILKAVHIYEKKATIEQIVSQEVYRKVLYLNGLDCAHCATKIETLAKKTLKYDKLLVDFASYRFIIESSDKEQMEHLMEEVTQIAKRVDDRIVVTENSVKKEEKKTEEEQKTSLIRICLLSIGGITFLLSLFFLIDFNFVDWKLIFTHQENVMDGAPNHVVHIILLTITYILIGYPIIWRFFKNLVRGRIFDENCLMTVASLGAIFTSHFVEAIVVLALFQLGEYLQHRAVHHCRKSIAELLSIDVKTAKLKKGDEIVELGVESILPEDIIVVKKGEMIPLDGTLIDAKAVLDTKNLTGESLLRHVSKGDEIMAGSINMGKVIEIKVLRPYSESMITKILDMVENASISKAKAENFITKFSRYYTPIILLLAIIIGVGGYFYESNITWDRSLNGEIAMDWIYRAMLFLVISCPCALVISIPLCFFAGIGVSSKRGILIKGSNYLEALYHVENCVFDKTGTLTKGEFKITKVEPVNESISKDEVFRNLIYVEFYSNHPIGMSIVDEYGRDNVFSEIISDFQDLSGGARASINGNKITVGNFKLMQGLKIEVPQVEENGLVIYVVKETTYLGYVVIGDSIREEAKPAIQRLRELGVKKFYILTGDAKGIAENVAQEIGVDEVYPELLPDQKVQLLQQIRDESAKKGKTVFVGDGMNDAPVIAASDIGIAMGTTGSDATIAISDVVIMSDDLTRLPELIKVAKDTRVKVVQNIVICLACKALVILLSAIPSITLPLWLAIFSDVGISLIAILNSIFIMRLFQRKNKKEIKEKEAEV